MYFEEMSVKEIAVCEFLSAELADELSWSARVLIEGATADSIVAFMVGDDVKNNLEWGPMELRADRAMLRGWRSDRIG
jgi:hypothetical protein